MMLVALGLLLSVALAAGLSGPVAGNAVRAGRADLHAVRVDRLAGGVLATWIEEPWADSTVGLPAGAVVSWTGTTPVPGLVSTRRMRSLGGGLWLLEVSVRQLDQAGGIVAAARRGWVGRVGIPPGDSVPAGRPLGRGLVRGFQ